MKFLQSERGGGVEKGGKEPQRRRKNQNEVADKGSHSVLQSTSLWRGVPEMLADRNSGTNVITDYKRAAAGDQWQVPGQRGCFHESPPMLFDGSLRQVFKWRRGCSNTRTHRHTHTHAHDGPMDKNCVELWTPWKYRAKETQG